MKSKILIATLVGCLAWQQGALSQTNTTATNPAATNEVAPASQPATVTDSNQVIDATATALPVAPAVTNVAAPPAAPAVIGNIDTNANVIIPPAAPAASATEAAPATTAGIDTNANVIVPPATPAAPAASTTEAAPAATDTNASVITAPAANAAPVANASSAPQSIPLIQFQDVPITTAIENLARQAGINYLIDPKIGYGQPDQSGQVKPEPTLSIRWENVTAEQALMALLDNYGLQLVADRKTQIARITTKDPTAPLPLSTRVIQLKYASTSNMVSSIQPSLTDKRSKVLSDVRTSQLVVVATENEQEAVDALVNELDKPTRQVLIETKLVEISSNPTTKKGIDWSDTLSSQSITFGNGYSTTASTTTIPGNTTTTSFGDHSVTSTAKSTSSTTVSTTGGSGGMSWNTASGFSPSIGFLSADGLKVALSFLNASYDAQVVSTPRIVTLDNETATIEVTRGYPVMDMTGGTQNSSGSSSVTYSNVGTLLQVTPRISANDYIWLKVIPVVSSHFGDVTVTVAGGGGNSSTSYTIPEFDTRKIDSQVMIPNGNTLVMGGLVQDNPTASYTKVPILGDIPGLGWAFRSESKTMTKDNLIIFMTPTIIQNSDFQQASSASADFLKSKPALMKPPMNPNSSWDGAKPRSDWSDPSAGEYDK